MKFIRSLIIFILFALHINVYAANNDDFEWMHSSIKDFDAGCIEVPKFTNIEKGTHLLNLDNAGEWVSTGKKVSDGKLLEMEWSLEGVQPRTDKYKVLYRIDPRFERPQIFIQKYDYAQDKYISDFHQFKDGKLLRYQKRPEMTILERIQDFVDYFNFNGRSKIPVKKNDVINITMDQSGSYFGSNSEMDSELGSIDNLLLIYTQSSLPNNRIIYSNSKQWCNDAITKNRPEYSQNCLNYPGFYMDSLYNWKTLEGRIDNRAFNANKLSIDSCADGADGRDNNPLCYYDMGRGMVLSLGGTTIKPVTEKFMHSTFTGKDFFYHNSDIDGELDFTTDWAINGMYQNYKTVNNSSVIITSQFFKDWKNFSNTGEVTYSNFIEFSNILKQSLFMNFMHFGRYLMSIEIGNSNALISKEDLSSIQVEYIIMSNGSPTKETSGTSINQNFRGNADKDGYLWIRVLNPDNKKITGKVQVKTANYIGSTMFSDNIYKQIIKPIHEMFNDMSNRIYIKIIGDSGFQNIARAMLVLYVVVYGLIFLAGATEITVSDIVIRILKIGLIVALLGDTSWEFFNNNLFRVFTDGIDSLLTAVVGVTSSAGNVFGFIDPIIDKYTNGTVWGLLFIQALQIHTGLTFFAIMTMYSILIYFRALLEIIVSYCLAFIGLAIMISIAPFFIILILFERTKSIFDNWISTMFSYMIQPTILLIFFLLIDQIIGDQITQVVVDACWKKWFDIKIGLDLSHIGIPITTSFVLPFFPYVSFYVPITAEIGTISDFFEKSGTIITIATSSLLFFIMCKLAQGLVDYVTLVVQYLTNVLAARQDGKLQKSENPIKDITNDMGKLASPVSTVFRGVKDFGKEKFIDQKITHRHFDRVGDIDYSKVKKTESSRDDD